MGKVENDIMKYQYLLKQMAKADWTDTRLIIPDIMWKGNSIVLLFYIFLTQTEFLSEFAKAWEHDIGKGLGN